MNIPRSTQFAALQLHHMPVNCEWTIQPNIVRQWEEMWIRRMVSAIKAKYNINLRCNKGIDGSLRIWHSPEKTTQGKSVAFDKLVWLRGQIEEYRQRKLADPNPNAFLNEMLAIQEQIEQTLIIMQYKDGEPLKRRGNAISQPLPVILSFYGLTEEIWSKIPPKLQIKKKIQAEVAIKNRRRALEQPQ